MADSPRRTDRRTSRRIRVRPASDTHPNADQFALRSGGPSAVYVNPRCRLGQTLVFVAVTHVLVYPDDWNGLDDHSRIEYTASAKEHGIELRVAHPASPNPDQLVTVINGDFAAISAPYYLGPAQCGRARWEHNLRELLDMDDPCFPNPFRDQPGSIRTL